MLTLYNTLSKQKEPFDKTDIGFYSCGPTVYDFAHIGNFRAYVTADILKRYLQYRGVKVKHVMNLTDVDDKTIRNSRAANTSLKSFTEKFSSLFFEDLQSLNIKPADVYPKATEHIPEMIALIETLLKKGVAYQAADGIYFDIAKFPSYGRFAHIVAADLKAGARVANDEYDKQSAQDFALWKFWTEKDGDVVWDAPFGRGRPGWHIECSAMSMKHLGESFALHSGGVDLIFPHHQNEIAQSEAATGKPFVRTWVHNEHLIVDGKKMSKSLGNFFTLRDILKKGYEPLAVRYALLAVHYRQQLNFTFESLKAAQSAVARINDFHHRMRDIARKRDDGFVSKEIEMDVRTLKDGFATAMDDDLGVSEALASVHAFLSAVNAKEADLSGADAAQAADAIADIDQVLGILSSQEDALEPELQALIDEREQARKDRDFKRSDELRKLLLDKGIQIDDQKDGYRWKRAKNL